MKTNVSIIRALLFLGLLLSVHEASAVNLLTTCQPLTSGVYLLNADVFAPANSPCFTMTANNITLNLGGHTIFGSAGAAAITDGGVARRAISVASGTMVVDIGVDLFASSEVRVESLNVDSAAGPAIATGAFSKILGNVVATTITGIKVQCPSLLVWNDIFQGDTIVEVGKGCKEVENMSTKK